MKEITQVIIYMLYIPTLLIFIKLFGIAEEFIDQVGDSKIS
jgi:hypothetical protein